MTPLGGDRATAWLYSTVVPGQALSPADGLVSAGASHFLRDRFFVRPGSLSSLPGNWRFISARRLLSSQNAMIGSTTMMPSL